jgi:hypothetical protein
VRRPRSEDPLLLYLLILKLKYQTGEFKSVL